MKNILARGGIEFLAVLLGISGSLWIDDWSNSRSDISEEYSAYVRLSKAMEHDILNIEKELEKNNKMVDVINHLITNIENISADSLTLYIDQTQSYVTLMPQFSDYEALKSTGKLYKISDFDLLQKIIDLYDNKYGEIDRLMVEDKRAIFMQDEFFIKNYAMQPAKVWTTLKDAKTDLLRIKSDKVYMNYLVFMYKVKMQVNERWTKLIDEIKIVKNEIDLKKQNRAN
ncbi:MAG: hypothetical protein ACJZ1P_04360 [Candidatus Neomarinimicrobiota bacterium]|tara:strand:- start:395 stop:1078 length:684 start_codon:yes stop_codon:yes gene_type:complete